MPVSPFLHLTSQLVRRDLATRFTGSALGVAWAVIQPISLIALYWFIFGIMLPGGRVGSGAGGGYAYFLISGLLPWIGFSEGVSRGTTSIVENGAIVKRLPFRSEILVLVPNVTALIFEMIAMALFVGLLAVTGRIGGCIWLLPIPILIQLGLQTGIGLILSATYVVFRDVVQILGFVLSVVFYLSPVLYDVHGQFEAVFRWNPLTPLLGLFRYATIGGALPPAASIVFLLSVTVVLVFAGGAFFRRAQHSLVDLV